RGFKEIGSPYLGNARRAYLRWGADGKVRQLDTQLTHVGDGPPASMDTRATIGATVEQLELATVLRILDAVSDEGMLEDLLVAVLRTATEHAGAERGLLIEPRDDDFCIRAEARTTDGTIAVALRGAAISASEVPQSVVRHVARTHEVVCLDDASATGAFSND